MPCKARTMLPQAALLLAILPGLMMAAPAAAQTAPAAAPALDALLPKVDSDTTCSKPDPDLAAALHPFTARLLEPGQKLNLAELLKSMPPGTLAKMASMQKLAAERQARDFADLCKYREENAAVLASGVRPDVVFLGDSITENWKLGDPGLFGAKVLDRGISGQTTPQILLRFYQDVVALRPRVVHIMAGTNDVSGNTGPTTDAAILGNIEAMIDIAQAHRIAVVLSAITPTTSFFIRPGFNPWPRIAGLNRELARIAHARKVTLVDYGPVLDGGDGSLKATLGNDGLHPNRDGYKVMRPLADKAIASALGTW